MRSLLALLTLAAILTAQDVPKGLTDEIGGVKAWGKYPAWQQRDMLRKWKRFESLPAEKQAEIRKRGLKRWLIGPEKRFKLPQSLDAEVKKLPKEIQPLVRRFAVMLLRTMRLDRHLSLVPVKQRRPLFDQMFPRRFDREKAHAASEELKRHVSRAMASKVMMSVKKQEVTLGRSLGEEERAKLVHEFSVKEEERLHAKVRRQIRRFRGARLQDVRRRLESSGYHVLARHPMRSPRQRELIRYAFHPERCPLVRMKFMGKRPEDPAERRLWDHDFRVLARIELLSSDFPPEMVLHLAAASSPADFFRAVKAFSGRKR